jgi:hypothetical protein
MEKVTDDEWEVWNKKEQRSDALLSFFNEKYNPVADRHATIRDLLKIERLPPSNYVSKCKSK